MHEDMKRRENAYKKDKMRKEQEEELKRKKVEDEEKKRAEDLKQRQIEAEKRKEDYRKKIEEQRKEELAKKQQPAMINKAPEAQPKKKITEILHNTEIIKAEQPDKTKIMDEMISKDIYRMLEEMASHYIRKDYENAKSIYAQINLKYEKLSEEGKITMKPIINKVVNKISQ